MICPRKWWADSNKSIRFTPTHKTFSRSLRHLVHAPSVCTHFMKSEWVSVLRDWTEANPGSKNPPGGDMECGNVKMHILISKEDKSQHLSQTMFLHGAGSCARTWLKAERHMNALT